VKQASENRQAPTSDAEPGDEEQPELPTGTTGLGRGGFTVEDVKAKRLSDVAVIAPTRIAGRDKILVSRGEIVSWEVAVHQGWVG